MYCCFSAFIRWRCYGYKKGYDERDKIIENALLRQITTKPVDYYSLERLNLLAHLISDNILDIKIAIWKKMVLLECIMKKWVL